MMADHRCDDVEAFLAWEQAHPEDLEATLAAMAAEQAAADAARQSQPHWASCKDGKHGYFWIVWPAPPGAAPWDVPPLGEGYAPTYEDAQAQAAAVCGVAPCPGCRHGGRAQHPPHDLGAFDASRVLQRRATRRRLARPPSKRRDSQVHRLVYYHAWALSTDRSGVEQYIPHQVLRESPRFFWVNVRSVPDEQQRPSAAEALQTWRVDRQALARGEEWQRWVLALPVGATLGAKGWYRVATHGGQDSGTPWLQALGLAWPCTPRDVTRAYRTQARRVHPDVGGSQEDFLALQRAYAGALAELGAA